MQPLSIPPHVTEAVRDARRDKVRVNNADAFQEWCAVHRKQDVFVWVETHRGAWRQVVEAAFPA